MDTLMSGSCQQVVALTALTHSAACVKILDQSLTRNEGRPRTMALLHPARPELMCPITHEMLQDPVVCPNCGQSFSADALQTYLRENREGRCPLCNVNVGDRGWARNVALGDIIQSMRANQLRTESLGGNTFVYTRPFVIIIVGSYGSGKSTLINILVDPSGTRIIAEEAASARGCTQRADSLRFGFNFQLFLLQSRL